MSDSEDQIVDDDEVAEELADAERRGEELAEEEGLRDLEDSDGVMKRRGGAFFMTQLPEWKPESRRFGIYPPEKRGLHGTTIVVVGPAGSGKTRVLQTLCAYAWSMVHGAVLASATNVRSMQFDSLNMFQQDAIIERPAVEQMDKWVLERNEGMRLWREEYDDGRGEYVQRSMLYVFDDMGFASKLLYRRTDMMLEMFSNRRHLALHLWMALQHMGQLNKQLREQVGIYIFVREQLAGGLAAMWEACFKGGEISARVFRQMVDEVCVKGKRVLVFIPAEGRLFFWELPVYIEPLPYPLGSSAWHALGEEYGVDEDEKDTAVERLRAAALAGRKRNSQPVKKKNSKR